MKIKNKTFHSEDREHLTRLAEELDFIGRPYRLDLKAGTLTQFALPPKKVNKNRKANKNGRAKRETTSE